MTGGDRVVTVNPGDPGKTGAGGTAPGAGGTAPPNAETFVGATAAPGAKVTLIGAKGATIDAVPLTGAAGCWVRFPLTRGAEVGARVALLAGGDGSLMFPILLFINPIFGVIRFTVLKMVIFEKLLDTMGSLLTR